MVGPKGLEPTIDYEEEGEGGNLTVSGRMGRGFPARKPNRVWKRTYAEPGTGELSSPVGAALLCLVGYGKNILPCGSLTSRDAREPEN